MEMAIITISRGTMSGGKKLAYMLADKLGYKCLSREIIIKAADDYGIEEFKLFEAIRNSPSILQKLTFERERYLAYIQASLCEYAKDDNLIYHGHAGHFLLKGISHVLRIRIVADMNYRIKATMEQQRLDKKEAEKYIIQVDKERIKWTKFLYGKDWTSPDLYDIVINLEHTDFEFICSLVLCAVAQTRFKTTPESTKSMNDLLLASRVRAALAAISQIRLGNLYIKANDGNVTIQGRSRSQETSDSILEIASKVSGVVEVKSNVEVDYRSFKIE
jgi:cytidylate kinase